MRRPTVDVDGDGNCLHVSKEGEGNAAPRTLLLEFRMCWRCEKSGFCVYDSSWELEIRDNFSTLSRTSDVGKRPKKSLKARNMHKKSLPKPWTTRWKLSSTFSLVDDLYFFASILFWLSDESLHYMISSKSKQRNSERSQLAFYHHETFQKQTRSRRERFWRRWSGS